MTQPRIFVGLGMLVAFVANVDAAVAPSGLSVSSNSATSLKLTWTNNDPSPLSHQILRSLDDVTFVPIISVNGGVTSYINVQLIPGTTYYYCVKTKNTDGTLSACSPSASGVPSVQDDVQITSPLTNTYINVASNSTTFPVSGTCNVAAAPVTVKIDGVNAPSQVGGTCNGSTWSATVDVTGLSEGGHTFDAVMGTGDATNITITKDTNVPTSSINAPNLSEVMQGQSNYFDIDYADVGTGLGSITLTTGDVSLSTTGSASCTISSISTVDADTVRVNLTNCTGSGTVAINIAGATATDVAGNPTAAEGPSTTFDVIEAELAITSPPDDSYINIANDSATFAVSGTCNVNGASIDLLVDSSAAPGWSGATCNGTTWSGTIDTTGLSEGAHIIDATMLTADASDINVTKDTNRPTNVIGSPDQAEIFSGGTNYFDIDYADIGTGLDSITLSAGDISLSTTGTATCDIDSISTVDADTRRVNLTNCTGEGTVAISIDAATATDVAGNTSLAAGPGSTFIIYPTPTILINADATHTPTTSVLLSMNSAFDYEMYVTNKAGCTTDGTWEPYKLSRNWTLGTTNETTNVYVKFRNSSLTESACVSDSIVHDSVAPDNPTFVSTNPASPSTSTTVLVKGSITATDIAWVRLYRDSTCLDQMASGTVTAFEGVGIGVVVVPGSSTAIYAKTADNATNMSSCVFLTTYVNNGTGTANTWYNMAGGSGVTDLAAHRSRHTAVWTGHEMIIWGGIDSSVGGDPLSHGLIYNPTTDSWRAVAATNTPQARSGHAAVWTGKEMIVWGGANGSTSVDTGGRYNPFTDTWTATSTTNVPSARSDPTAVWTGHEMIVWGGSNGSTRVDTGGRYNPATDTWTATSSTDAPSARYLHTAVWTGTEMIVWGGNISGTTTTDSGASYNPVTDTWTSIGTFGTARAYHTAVWTGTEMIVWGGINSSSVELSTGHRYTPGVGWSNTSGTSAPAARYRHTAVWTGSKMIIWGGEDSGTEYDTGAEYDPSGNSWSATTTSGAPAARSMHSAVWAGNVMIVSMGVADSNAFEDSRAYLPGTGWVSISDPTSVGQVVQPRYSHTAVWTGSEIIVFGGKNLNGVLAVTEIYDPLTNSWAVGSTSGEPSARELHTAVWDGSEMIVWGGFDGSVLDTGGRYDPSGDSWTATTTTGAPSARQWHTAIWDGSEMIVWGGLETGDVATDTGGRYDPTGDSWTATSTTSAPSAREKHTAVWTGSEMIVWGGRDLGVPTYYNTGGKYDPSGDSWTATSTTDAPTARMYHTAVWTGTEMIIWGGHGSPPLMTGARYTPGADTWVATTTTGLTIGRKFHSAVWISPYMIIFGGVNNDIGSVTALGDRYRAVSDSWVSMSTTNLPSNRSHHTATTDGALMYIIGGTSGCGECGQYERGISGGKIYKN